jgi:hypothetical protein
MLRRISLAAVAAATLAYATTAQAQRATTTVTVDGGERRPMVGIGIIANTAERFVLVPLNVSPVLKVEPFAGFNTFSASGGADVSSFLLGAGVFYVLKTNSQLDLLFGGRLGLDFVSVSQAGTSTSGTDLQLVGAAGAEYYLQPRFSVGMEGQLGFFSNSKATTAAAGEGSGIITAGLATLRFYF